MLLKHDVSSTMQYAYDTMQYAYDFMGSEDVIVQYAFIYQHNLLYIFNVSSCNMHMYVTSWVN